MNNFIILVIIGCVSLFSRNNIRAADFSAFSQWHVKTLLDVCDYYDTLQNDYDDDLDDDALQLPPRQFVSAQLWLSHFSADSAYVKDPCGGNKRVSIPDLIFGPDIHIRDIFLASTLAEQGKITLPGQNPGFGSVREEQYIACTADTTLSFSGKIRQTAAELNFFYTFPAYRCYKLAMGLYIPIKHQERRIELDCAAGFLVCGQPNNFVGESNVAQFFNDFIDFQDYFKRGILGQKCIDCRMRQEKTGVGDVSVALVLDLAEASDYLQIARFGIMGILPTGCIRSGDALWEVELGTGAMRFRPFVDIHTWTGYQYFNPRFYLGVTASVPFYGMRRVPQLKNTKSQLLLPYRYEPFIVAPFESFDTTKREFADKASCVRIAYGPQVDLSIGNLFFNIMRSTFSAGIFYEASFKGRDTYCVWSGNGTFDTSVLASVTNEQAHGVRWNVQWSPDGRSVFEFGARQVLGGYNTLCVNELFASLILYY